MDLVVKLVLFCLSQGLFCISADADQPTCIGQGAKSCTSPTTTTTTTTTTKAIAATTSATKTITTTADAKTTATATTSATYKTSVKPEQKTDSTGSGFVGDQTTKTTVLQTRTAGRQYKYEAVYIVVPVVVVVVAIIIGVICYIKRRQIKLSLSRILYRRSKRTETNSHGTAITNTTYNGTNIALKESPTSVHTNQSLDSGYSEIPVGATGDIPDSEYQTIDILPEDETVSSNTYGHLKENAGCFDSKTYSHIGGNHAGTMAKPPRNDMDYSHIGKPGQDLQLPVSKETTDNTYNTLDTVSKSNIGRNVMKAMNTNDGEAEYDHAIGGRTGFLSEMKIPDEYTHLNSKLQKTQTLDMAFNQTVKAENEDELHELNRPGYPKDSEKLITLGDKSATEQYSKVMKNNSTTEIPNISFQGNDGNEPAGNLQHDYLVLLPDEEPGKETDNRFHVVENEGSNEKRLSECEESQNHQYFILEKNSDLT